MKFPRNTVVSVKKRFRTTGLALVAALSFASGLLTAPHANAVSTLFWDGGVANIGTNGDGASQGGLGTWSTVIQNWDQGSGLAHVAWTNGSTAADFGGTAGAVSVNSGITVGNLTFEVGGYAFNTNALTLTSGSVITTNSGTTTFNVALTGSTVTALTKAGAGTLSLSQSSGLGTGAAPTVWTVNGGSFSSGSFTSVLSAALGNNLGTAPTAAATQVILDSGTLELRGGGADNTNVIGSTRTTVVNTAGGAIRDTSGFVDNLNGAITDNAGVSSSSYLANTGGTTLFTGVISGGGSVTGNSTGTLDLTATNTYNGGTIVNSGLLQLRGASGANTSAMTYTVNGGTLALDNTTATVGGIAGGNNNNRINDSSAITLNSGNFTFKGTDAAATNSTETVGALTASGNSTVTITPGGTNTATLTVASLGLGGGASGNAAAVNIGSTGVLSLGGDVTYDATNNPNGATISGASGFVSLNGTRTFNVGDSSAATNDLTVGAVIQDGSGSSGIIKNGAGTLFLNATNTFSGGITLNAGTLGISVGGSLGAATAVANAASPAQITFGGNSTFQIGNNNLLNTRPLLINPGVTATIDTGTGNTAGGVQGVISGSGNLVKIGSSPLSLTGVDTYNGTTLVSGAGVLAVGSGGRLTATSGITVNNGGTLLLSGSGTADRINNAANVSLGGTGNNTVAAAGGAKEGSAATVVGGTPSGTNAFGIGVLNVLAASTIDFDSASNGNLMVFNGFSGLSTVTVTNWTNVDFNGTTNSGLSTDSTGWCSVRTCRPF